ncbi:MAG: phosphate signaling complex protein PhoU [candidate division KSB1 bacterium]|nr:phosphate signaling complex protein PhoU [candidate division KSB1 bacterium]MDZ7412553.1 phosphate signaling complex protein PhoU [candidate division KSB1 bacterium]
MERHFHEQLQELRATLTQMASMVEGAINKAVESLIEREKAMAEAVIAGDEAINDLELAIEDQCLKLLALHQPMAVDLRFITSAIKINNDLERMGDHAVNIAERSLALCEQEQLKPLIDIPRMAVLAQQMVKDSIHSFVTGDVARARTVCVRDDEVDKLDDQVFRELLTYMAEDPRTISRALHLIIISKNLERIADLSTNIAEEVIFIYEAHTIKHHAEEKGKGDVRGR